MPCEQHASPAKIRVFDFSQEALLTQAELMDLKATPRGLVEGVVIESTTSTGLGPQCTLVVHRGTLRKGSALIAGESYCRVRTMHNEYGQVIGEAGPSFPVRVAGEFCAQPLVAALPSPFVTFLRNDSVVVFRFRMEGPQYSRAWRPSARDGRRGAC